MEHTRDLEPHRGNRRHFGDGITTIAWAMLIAFFLAAGWFSLHDPGLTSDPESTARTAPDNGAPVVNEDIGAVAVGQGPMH